MKRFSSHGSGEFHPSQLGSLGENVIFEPGVLIFHPEQISLGHNIYVGHQTILKGYYRNRMVIGDDTWIGQQCFFHSAGGLEIGRGVGIGPGVKILTSRHQDPGRELAIMEGALELLPVSVGDGCDLGMGCMLLPGVRLGKGVQVGAGAVVTMSVPDFAVVAGVPARILRLR